MGSLKNPAGVDYSKYKCPYEHLQKDFGHGLCGPEGYEDTYGVWCACGFRGPEFYLNPEDLKLEPKEPKLDLEKYLNNSAVCLNKSCGWNYKDFCKLPDLCPSRNK